VRHRVKSQRFGRSTSHREALVVSLVCNLIEQRRIRTTLPKAKAARSLAERMVTLGKRGTLAARRQAIAKLRRKDRVATLFNEVAPAFKERAGGYTRIVKLGRRASDSSEMALLEWVEQTAAAFSTEKTPSGGGEEEKEERPLKGLGRFRRKQSETASSSASEKPAEE